MPHWKIQKIQADSKWRDRYGLWGAGHLAKKYNLFERILFDLPVFGKWVFYWK